MPKLDCVCATCGKTISRHSRQVAKSKTGLFYCCKQHQKKWRFHRKTAYRKLAFDNHPHQCDECGYKAFPEILEVHHVNMDRQDNRLHNLRILCPNCHRELHFLEGGLSELEAPED